MYFLSFQSKGDCSLSRSTIDNESKIIMPSISLWNDNITLMGYSVKSSIKETYSKDFISIKFTSGKLGDTFFGSKRGHGIIKSIYESGGLPMYPFISFNGSEKYYVMHIDKESLDKNLELVEKTNKIINYDYNIIKSNDAIMDIFKKLNMEINELELTVLERKIISFAFLNGYFDWPRNLNLENLAENFGISKPSTLFHIRNVERKIISCFVAK
jgi:predicted DNA binding protein